MLGGPPTQVRAGAHVSAGLESPPPPLPGASTLISLHPSRPQILKTPVILLPGERGRGGNRTLSSASPSFVTYQGNKQVL